MSEHGLHDAFLLGAARTPIGAFQGALSELPAPRLGAIAIREAVARAGLEPSDVSEVIMGCVLQGGLGQAPARQATIFAGLPDSTPATTVNKVCGSGLKAVMIAADQVRLGEAQVVVAGGMESMSQAPYLLPQARGGMRLGHGKVVDLLIHDGLWDAYHDQHMGSAAELCARERTIDRQAQDAFAAESYRRALEAQRQGWFQPEIVAVEVPQRKGEPKRVELDEEPGRGQPEKFTGLRPAFDKSGTITAANASSLNDGAAALVVANGAVAERTGRRPLARIVAHASHAQAPEWFTTAPAKAIARLLDKAGLEAGDIDLFEINEAFAVVSLATNQELGLDPAKVNVHGGAVALGHPIGASGARVLVTLLHALERTGGRLGVASLCIGGGEAVALLVERV